MSRFDAHRFLYRAALALSNAFVFTLLFSFFDSLVIAATLYVFTQIVTLVLTPITARFVSHGSVRLMMSAGAVLALSFTCLALFMGVTATYDVYYASSAALLFALLFGMARALYWTPYRLHTSEAYQTQCGTLLSTLREMTLALLPFLAGYIIVQYGASWLLWIGALLATLSLVFLVREADVVENYSLSYRESWVVFFSPQLRAMTTGSIAEGVHASALFFVWPIAALVILSGSYVLLGIVMSAVLLITLLFKLLVGHFGANGLFQISRGMHATLTAFAWVMRVIIITPLQIIAVDVFQNLRLTRGDNSVDPFTYEQAADGGSIVDEHSAIKEMGFAVGRALLALVVLVAASVLSLTQALVVTILFAAVVGVAAPYLNKSV